MLARLQILVIRSWVAELQPIRAALAAVGLSVELTTVDFEAALNAALTRGGYDVVIYDPETPGLSHDAVLACFRGNRCEVPLLVLEDLGSLAARVQAALATLAN